MRRFRPCSNALRWSTLLLAATGLWGCATPPAATPSASEANLAQTDWAQASALTPDTRGLGWEHQVFGNRKPSRYRATHVKGRPALQAEGSGNSLVRYRVQVTGEQLGVLRFSWLVPQLYKVFDLRDRDNDDAVARVILTFDGNKQNFTPRDRLLSELAQLVTGEPLPHATLMYVWDHTLPVGTVLDHPTTRRIKVMVVRSGPGRLGEWVDMERDIRADYKTAFGEDPSALIGVGLMTDGNNTGVAPTAWYGPVALQARR